MAENLSFEKQRDILVEKYLKGTGISDERVLQAFREVPRHEFVFPQHRKAAYENRPLPIGEGQVITQPSLAAAMSQALQLRGGEKVLEIGTGSGFQAAILAKLAGDVYTIERIETLARRAEQTLKRLGFDNVHVIVSNGTTGLPEEAPFDAIMVTAGGPRVPQPLVEQLKEGGRLVIPVGQVEVTQMVKLGIKRAGKLEFEDIEWAHFVPLIGEHGWEKEELNDGESGEK